MCFVKHQILQHFDISSFQQQLLEWYEEEKRDLPWRRSANPYHVWVSEIMLQQTRVDTVIPYFERFITLFPTVHDLAEADEQTVLKLWEGLGYYSRARNLHHAAKKVVREYGGIVPKNVQDFGSLKGVGPYTRGAVMSIAYGLPEPAVDGNVMRVLSRVLMIEENISEHRVKKEFEELTRELVPKEDPSSFNQGLMELGALVCTPKQPTCLLCPVESLCRGYAHGMERELPIKGKKKKQRTIHYAALLIEHEGKFVIEQRPPSGLLASLWQFPMIPLDEMPIEDGIMWLQAEYGLDVSVGKKAGTLKHVFSHIIWEITIYHATMKQLTDDERIKNVYTDELPEYPFPVSHLKMFPYIQGEQ